jgi:hypothetical protein
VGEFPGVRDPEPSASAIRLRCASARRRWLWRDKGRGSGRRTSAGTADPGAGIYKAQLNAETPVGAIQSIEHALRSLEKAAEQERDRAARAEKMLADYQEQMGKPFEHEARLKDLLVRQAAVNAALDLDKGERQLAPEESAECEPGETGGPWVEAPYTDS